MNPLIQWLSYWYYTDNKKEFAEDIGIDKPKLGQFSNAVMALLEKSTPYKYTSKNGTVSPKFYEALDPQGFHRNRINKGVWGIHLEDEDLG